MYKNDKEKQMPISKQDDMNGHHERDAKDAWYQSMISGIHSSAENRTKIEMKVSIVGYARPPIYTVSIFKTIEETSIANLLATASGIDCAEAYARAHWHIDSGTSLGEQIIESATVLAATDAASTELKDNMPV